LEGLNIEIVYLPTYGQNLNSIGRLWKFFKKKVLHFYYYENFKDFKLVCATFFRGIRKYEAELATLITDNFSAVGT
jgi:transposase